MVHISKGQYKVHISTDQGPIQGAHYHLNEGSMSSTTQISTEIQGLNISRLQNSKLEGQYESCIRVWSKYDVDIQGLKLCRYPGAKRCSGQTGKEKVNHCYTMDLDKYDI